jgi:hypothetical protein
VDVIQTIAYILGGLCLPIILGMLTLLMRHMAMDHTLEIEVKTKQAFLEGESKGLNERISRLEDIRDFTTQGIMPRRDQ